MRYDYPVGMTLEEVRRQRQCVRVAKYITGAVASAALKISKMADEL